MFSLSASAHSVAARVSICANKNQRIASQANQRRQRITENKKRVLLIVKASDDDNDQDDGDNEEQQPRQRGGRGGAGRGAGGRGGGRGRGGRGAKEDDPFTENVVQVSRVTKVTKGGSQMSFRATVVVGDGKGTIGVGCKKAKEVSGAVMKASSDARKSVIKVPIAKGDTIPHRVTVKGNGGAHVMLRPAAPGTGVIAGGSCRAVLELAGYKNCFAKQLGSNNPLNNARATVKGLAELRMPKEVAANREMTLEELFSA
jgi:small subunit ribosomal protein S5